jgi:hypothetical protein
MRPTPRYDLCGGGTTRRTVLAVRHGFQVILLAFVQHVGAVGRTSVARSLAIRAGFGTFLHRLAVFHVFHLLFLRLPLLGERNQTDDGKGQRHHAAEFVNLHGAFLFLKNVISTPATEIVISTQVTEIAEKKTDVNEHIQVSIHVGLLCNEPPDTAGLPFIKSSDDSNFYSTGKEPPLRLLQSQMRIENDDSRRNLVAAESRKQPKTSGDFTSPYRVNRSKPSERQCPWLPRCDLSASLNSSRIWHQPRR